MPVKAMTMSFLSHSSMTRSSRMEPPGIAYVPLRNWHQALYMCILYDKWLEPPVWDFIEIIVKAFRRKKGG